MNTKALAFTLISSIFTGALGFDLNCNNNQVFYWGQNSYGGAHLNQPELWEKDLYKYCDDDYMDVINLSFLNNFNAGTDLPEVNFANHCETFFNSTEASKLRHCPKIGQDIKYCQAKGKKIILSLGGAIARTGFSSSAAASGFADTLWNMFFKGNHKFRPFDDAVVDGIDLDLEGGSQAHYDVFLSKLQSYYKSDPSRKYYVSAAPQCVFPDGNLQTIMETGHIDFINIQFYNNWCGVHNYNNVWAWNWGDWDKWAHTKSFNKNIKLILGVPASQTAAGSGYISIDSLQKIITDLRVNNTFAGVMMWDASQSENNLIGGKTYGKIIKDFLNSKGTCGTTPTPTTTSTSTTSTTSTTTTSTTTSTTTTSTTTSTTTTTTTTTTSSEPKPTGSCPVSGQPCSGGAACNGSNFAVCNDGKWVVRSCSPGTVCAISGGNAYCDWPGANPAPPCAGVLIAVDN